MSFVATINVPGYLPMDDEPEVFDNVLEAWAYLADLRREYEDWSEDGEDYSYTYKLLLTIAEGIDPLGIGYANGGTVHGPDIFNDSEHDLGFNYSVSVAE